MSDVIGARISNRYACCSFTSTPARASAAAPAARSPSGTVPKRSAAAQIPAGLPYAPHEDAPMLNTWMTSPNDTSAGTSGARPAGSAPRPGASTKKSSSTSSRPGAATSM